MSFYNDVKSYIKNHTTKSDQIIQSKFLKEHKHGKTLSIHYKMHVLASELTSNNEVIESIVKKIIRKDYSKRSFAGKSDSDLATCNKRIYQYESYRTNKVKLVPSKSDRLDIFIEDIYLGELPENYTKDVLHYLQSTVIMSFAYINGGPYKKWNGPAGGLEKGNNPYDLTIYIQFS